MNDAKEKMRRQQENADLVERMRNGESFARIDTQATWFPPRPVIKKDPEAIRKLYGVDK